MAANGIRNRGLDPYREFQPFFRFEFSELFSLGTGSNLFRMYKIVNIWHYAIKF